MAPQIKRKPSRSSKLKSESARARKRTAQPSTALVKPDMVPRESLAVSVSQAIENTLIIGDLKSLTSEQRVEYAKAFAKSLGINILTRPFDYILFREFDGGPERLELYLNAKGAAQLRKIHRISTVPGTLKQEFLNDHCITRVDVRDGWGGTDTATGSVTLWKVKNGQRVELVGREWDNAIMKCETKAKRRATLSICGLAMLDESQLDTMQIIGGVTQEGRIYRFQDQESPQLEEKRSDHPSLNRSQVIDARIEELRSQGFSMEKACAQAEKEDAERFYRPQEPSKNVQAAPAQPETKPSPAQPVPQEQPNNAIPKSKPVPPMEFKGTVEINVTECPTCPIVRGDLANIIDGLQKRFPDTLKWGKDSWWHIAPSDVFSLMDVLAANGYKADVKMPSKSSAGKAKSAMTAAPPAGVTGRSEDKGSSAAPAVVKGTVEQANPESGKSPRMSILFKSEGKKYWMKAWSDKLFPWLVKAKEKNLECEVFVEIKEKDGKTFRNIVGLKRVGSQDFDDDGKTPAIQNKDREAGGRTLFP